MSTRYGEWLRGLRTSPEYWAEVAVDDFTRAIVHRMKARGVSRAELARRLGTSQAYVTKLLGGNANFTLLTMARVALALEGVVHVRVTDRDVIPLAWGEVRTGSCVQTVDLESGSAPLPARRPAATATGDQPQEARAYG